MIIKVRDFTSEKTNSIDGNTPCFPLDDLPEDCQFQAVDKGGILDRSEVDPDDYDEDLDEIPLTLDKDSDDAWALSDLSPGDQCVVYDSDQNTWWHSEVLS